MFLVELLEESLNSSKLFNFSNLSNESINKENNVKTNLIN